MHALHNELERTLKTELFDQDDAIDTVVETLLKSKLLPSNRPYKALFTFVGAPNCGKHYLAQKLLEHEPSLTSIKTFHMDWYTQSDNGEASNALTQELFEHVKEHPQSILLFEDIEKAELQVQLALFGLFSDTTQLAFTQCVIIFTTSRASSFIAQSDFSKLSKENELLAHTYLMEKLSKESMALDGAIEQAFDAKLLSLMNQNRAVPFGKLTLTSLIKIGARALHEMSQHFLHQNNIALEYIEFDKIASLLTLSLAPYLNAQHIKDKIPEVMFGHIYSTLKLHTPATKILCDLSAEAVLFLDQTLTDPARLLKQLRDQHQRVALSWEYSHTQEALRCTITNASFTKQVLAIHEEEALHSSEITFNDVAGHQKAKKELLEVVSLFKEPKRLARFGMSLPKGMILLGDPNIGKKMLARAFANELDMPYITLSGADLFDEKKIRKVYEKARTYAPSIVILEDLDIQGIIGGMVSSIAVAPFMAQMDALPQSLEPGIFTIATLSSTNAVLEPITASGYLELTVHVPKLDMEARRFFIEQILTLPNDGKIDVEKVVRYISGMDGKELKKIAYDAAMFAARKNKKQLTEAILLEQINSIKYGTKLDNRHIRDIEKSMETTAYHEAGHAVLSFFLMPHTKIEQVTVAPRSETLGFVSYNNDEYVDASSKEDLFSNICVLLGGRMATIHKYGEQGIETGAVSDLEIASLQVYAAIAIFGMDEKLANISVNGIEQGYTKELFNEQIQERMLVWLQEAKTKAAQEVATHWDAIEAVAQALIKKEVIDALELQTLIQTSQK